MPGLLTDRTNIYYEQRGSGPPLLLIAGMSSDSNSWQFVADDLSENFQLIMFDNRGCGRTDFSEPFTLENIADDACQVLSHLGHSRAHVLGHSMGGMIAQTMAVKHPDRIDKLILASSSPKLSDKAKGILDDLLHKWENQYDVSEWFRLMFKWLFNSKAVSNKNFMDAAIIFALSYPYAQTIEGFRAQVNAISSFNLIDSIDKINHSTLILSGVEDILIPPDESKLLMQIGGPVTFRTIEGAAHSLHAEKPAIFSRMVIDFLQE